MAAIDTHNPETSNNGKTPDFVAEGLGGITLRRDALHARTRAEAFLLTVRAVRDGIAAMRARRGND